MSIAHSKKFPEALTDIIVTEKSLQQEEGNGQNNQISLLTGRHMNKPDVRVSLLEWIPGLEIGKIKVIRISKKQSSKNSHGYTFHTGSNRSAVKADKKFVVTIYNYKLMADTFKAAMEYTND